MCCRARYREALPETMEALLMSVRGDLNLEILCAALRTLLTEQLVESVWPADASLKQVMNSLSRNPRVSARAMVGSVLVPIMIFYT
jgi:hypothetical protein